MARCTYDVIPGTSLQATEQAYKTVIDSCGSPDVCSLDLRSSYWYQSRNCLQVTILLHVMTW